ncbi:tRNA-binding protein [Brytella acorum]|uniref:tRNA-binding protein n=1 Tax=Brytella acorum TaxID=2959299 RepID=A0AA35V9U9_9PROT|nr:tRNA-binding protein [Brytella acorum]MDF3626057.1 tRNA-binding protein [Brytella acorum]CAI9122158.1 tRNA-binding protein [Brytella acorum]
MSARIEERAEVVENVHGFAADIRVGTVVHADRRMSAMRLQIDFGPGIGLRHAHARLASHYDARVLTGRQLCAVVNVRGLGTSRDEVLVLGMKNHAGEMVLIRPDQSVADGGRLF